MQGQKIDMTFDVNSLTHIMSVLTDLYSDPELAIIREYSTNAYDSHLAVGQKKPIEVSVPTALSPFFIVEDFGVGMSVADIENIYSKYGASTKRGTDSQTGMLGLGCKSALTYTGQFTLRCRKDGKQALVSISYADSGGRMEIIDVRDTDLPNGVKVQIPAKPTKTFTEKIDRFFRFWDPSIVTVTNQEINWLEARTAVDKVDFKIKIDDNLDKSYVVMGNVAYPLAQPLMQGINAAVFVRMGLVNFTPSREALHYTQLTKRTLESAEAALKHQLKTFAEQEIAGAENHTKAIWLASEWNRKLGYNNFKFKYKHKEIPLRLDCFRWVYRPGRNRYNLDSVSSWYTQSIDKKACVVGGFDGAEVSSSQRARIRRYLSLENLDHSQVYFIVDSRTDAVWLEGLPVYDWQEIKKRTKVSRSTTKPKNTLPVYDVWNGAVWDQVSKFNQSKVLYGNPAEWRNLEDWISLDQLKGYTLVRLFKNRFEKLQRDIPAAAHINDHLRKHVKDFLDNMTQAQRDILQAGYNDTRIIEGLVGYRHLLRDPVILNILSNFDANATKVQNDYRGILVLARHLGIRVDEFRTNKDQIFTEYPLVYYLSNSVKQVAKELVDYMNNKYRSKIGEI